MSLNFKKCEQTNNFNNANNLFNYCTAVIENRKIDSLSLSSLNSTIQQTCFLPTLANGLTTTSLTNNNLINNNNNTNYLYSASLNQNSNVLLTGEKPLVNENLVSWNSNKEHNNYHHLKLSNNTKKTSLKG